MNLSKCNTHNVLMLAGADHNPLKPKLRPCVQTYNYADECAQLEKQQAHRAHACRLGPQPEKAKLWKSV